VHYTTLEWTAGSLKNLFAIMSIEKLQVLAVVKDIKELFVEPRTEQVGTQACPSPNHLEEFCFRAHDLFL
jgi:hypothetical protein